PRRPAARDARPRRGRHRLGDLHRGADDHPDPGSHDPRPGAFAGTARALTNNEKGGTPAPVHDQIGLRLAQPRPGVGGLRNDEEPSMRLSLRFILPLALTLAAIAYAVVPLVDRFTRQWF